MSKPFLHSIRALLKTADPKMTETDWSPKATEEKFRRYINTLEKTKPGQNIQVYDLNVGAMYEKCLDLNPSRLANILIDNGFTPLTPEEMDGGKAQIDGSKTYVVLRDERETKTAEQAELPQTLFLTKVFHEGGDFEIADNAGMVLFVSFDLQECVNWLSERGYKKAKNDNNSGVYEKTPRRSETGTVFVDVNGEEAEFDYEYIQRDATGRNDTFEFTWVEGAFGDSDRAQDWIDDNEEKLRDKAWKDTNRSKASLKTDAELSEFMGKTAFKKEIRGLVDEARDDKGSISKKADNEELEMFFGDLNPAAQKKVLDFYGVSSPGEMNWDVVPIATLVCGK